MSRKGQDVCVVAGPGSGKTQVLVERFAWHVAQGMAPERILAITFTEKAAREIRQRLLRRFSGNPGLCREIDRAPVSTIDGFCLKLLKENAIAAEVDPEFEILDEMDSFAEQIAALERVLNRFSIERRDEFRKLLDAWKPVSIVANFLDVYEAIRTGQGFGDLGNRMEPSVGEALRELRSAVQGMVDTHGPAKSPKQAGMLRGMREWLARDPDGGEIWLWLAEFDANKNVFRQGPIYDNVDRVKNSLIPAVSSALAGAHFRSEWRTLLAILRNFDEEYRERKRRLAVLDFGDLEERALALLRSDRLRKRDLLEEFEFILMDELQDTNPLQWSILDEIRQPERFFAVGDVNQSIYGFRHAEPELFLSYQAGFAKRKEAVDELRRNYRSRPAILTAAGSVTGSLPGIESHSLIAGRSFSPKDVPSVEVIFAQQPGIESLWIARRIRDLAGTLHLDRRGNPGAADFSDIAVLARNSAVFEELEEAFEQFGIPYVVQRGRNFFDELEVVDLTNCLRVLARDDEEIAQYGLLRSPFFGCADEDLFLLRQAGRVLPDVAARRIEALRQAFRGGEPADLLLARLIDETGYEADLDPRARANVRKLLSLIRRFQAEYPGDIESWLRAMRDLRRLGREPNAPVLDSTAGVRVTTVHMAKGLEFPIVFLMAMHKGIENRSAPLTWSPAAGLGVNWRQPGCEDSLPDAAQLANRQRNRLREEQEASRLLYVAMTRAEEHLVLSFEKGVRGGWPEAVEKGLGIHWNIPPNHAVVQNGVRLMWVDGEPPACPAPAIAARPDAAIVIEPLAEDRQPQASLTVSAVVDFLECPYRYFLSVVAGWPKPESGRAAQTGTTVHALLAGQPPEGASAAVRALAAAFVNSDLGRRAAAAAVVEKEFAFIADAGGVLLSGTIDLWFAGAGHTVVVDYKSDRHISPEKLRAYQTQVQIYALVLENLLGTPAGEAYLFLLRESVALPVPLGPAAKTAALNAIRCAARAVEFPRNEGPGCLSCAYYLGVCPARPVFESGLISELWEEAEPSSS